MATLGTLASTYVAYSAVDTNFTALSSSSGDGTSSASSGFADTPSDFVSMDTATGHLTAYLSVALDDDTIVPLIKVVRSDGTTLLAGDTGRADGYQAFSFTFDSSTGTAKQNLQVAFSYVDTAATKADWDGASIYVSQTRVTNMASDAASLRIDYFALTGTYTSSTVTGTITSTLSAFTQTAVGVETDPDTFSGGSALVAITVTMLVDYIHQTLPAVGQSSAGTVEVPIYTGTAASTLPTVAQSATATYRRSFSGVAASALPVLSQASAADVTDPIFTATATSSLSAAIQVASGTYSRTVSDWSASAEVATAFYAGTTASSLQPVDQSASGRFYPIGSPIAGLQDNFNTAFDPTLWALDAGDTSSIVDGRLRLPYSGNILRAIDRWDLREGSAHWEMLPQVGESGQTASAFFHGPRRIGISTYATITVEVLRRDTPAGDIHKISVVNLGFTLTSGALERTFDSAAHRWNRVRHSGSTLFFDTSPDGKTWTNVLTGTITQPGLESLEVGLSSYSSVGTGYVDFDNFNITLHTGSSVQTLPLVTQGAAGSWTDPVYAATAVQTLPSLTQALTATWTDPTDIATIASVLQPVSQSAQAQWTDPVDLGVVNSPLQAVTQAATATTSPPSFDATASQGLPLLASFSTGTVTVPVYTADAASTLSPPTQAAVAAWADPVWTGSATQTLLAVTQSAAATHNDPDFVATGSSLLQGVAQSATAQWTDPVDTGTAGSTLAAVAQSAVGTFEKYYTATAASSLGGPGQSVPLVDTFTGANGTTLASHSPDSGSAWQALDFADGGNVPDNTFTIENNTVRSGATNSNAGSAWHRNTTALGKEYDVELTVSNRAVQANRVQNVGFRMSSTGTSHAAVDRYVVAFDNSTAQQVRLEKTAGGTRTVLASAAYALASTSVAVKIEVRDAAKKVFLNGVEVLSSSDNSITDGGRVGLQARRGADVAQYFDNLTITALAAGSLDQAATGSVTGPVYEATATSILGQPSQSAVGSTDRPVYAGTTSSALGLATQNALGTIADPVDTGVTNSLLGPVAQAASGTVAAPVYVATANSSLAQVTQDAIGNTERPIGVAAIFSELSPVNQAATASHIAPVYAGTLSSTLSLVQQVAVGVVADPVDTATATSVLSSLAQAAAGTITDPVDTGITNSLLPVVSQAAIGSVATPVFTGAVSSVLQGVSQTATGTVELPAGEGFATSTLQGVSQSASGSATAPVFTATTSSTLPSIYQTATALEEAPTFTATTVSTLPGIGQSATAHTPAIATAASTLQPIAQIVVGDISVPVYAAIADSALPALAQAVQGLHIPILVTGEAASALLPVLQQAIAAHALLGGWLQAIYTVHTVPPPITVEILASAEPAIVIYKSEVETELTIRTPEDEVIYAGIPVD